MDLTNVRQGVSGRMILYEDRFCTIFSAKQYDVSTSYLNPIYFIRSYSKFYSISSINIGKGIDVPVLVILDKTPIEVFSADIDSFILLIKLTKGALSFLLKQNIFKIQTKNFSYKDFNGKDILIAYHYRIISEGSNYKFRDFLDIFPFKYDNQIFKYPIDQMLNEKTITVLTLKAWMADFTFLNKEYIYPFNYKYCFELVLGPTKMEFSSVILTDYNFLEDKKSKPMKTSTLDDFNLSVAEIPIIWGYIFYYFDLISDEKFKLLYDYSNPKYEYVTLFLLQCMNYFEELKDRVYYKRFPKYYDDFYKAFNISKSGAFKDMLNIDPNKADDIYQFIRKLPKEFYRSEMVKKIIIKMNLELYK